MDDEFDFFLRQIVSLGSSLQTIKLTTTIKSTVESLLSILRQINQLQKPDQLKLEMEIFFPKSQHLEDFGIGLDTLIHGLQEEFVRTQDVSLKLFTDIRSEQIRKFLQVYGEKFDHFECYPLEFH